MREPIYNIFIGVITIVVPIFAFYIVRYINDARDQAMAETDDVRQQWYIQEITSAVSAAVTATSQTYVDSLKNAGEFTVEAQKEAAKKALHACLVSISPAAKEFIRMLYGEIDEYLTTLIEAEVRNQKLSTGT